MKFFLLLYLIILLNYGFAQSDTIFCSVTEFNLIINNEDNLQNKVFRILEYSKDNKAFFYKWIGNNRYESNIYLNNKLFRKAIYAKSRNDLIMDGPAYEFYSSGNLHVVQNFLNGKKYGVSLVFFPTGKLMQMTTYRKDILEGQTISFYENGNLESSGYMSKNGKIGMWTYYYENGVIKSMGNYKSIRIKNGQSVKYNIDEFEGLGEIVFIKVGEWLFFNDTGIIESTRVMN
jgi:antitoxin component YwqK of YwqJK toxin-antitoxin module